MALRALLPELKKDDIVGELTKLLEQDQISSSWIVGLHGSARAFFWSGMRERLRKPMLIVLSTQDDARQFYDQARLYLEHPDPQREELFLFPSKELLPYEHALTDMELEGERLEVLLKLLNKENIMIVCAVDQLLELIPDPAWLIDRTQTIHLGQHLNLDKLTEQLIELGYTREVMIEGRGQFAVRGGIIDIFASSELSPWRIELEGSEVSSIRWFSLSGDGPSTPGTLSEAFVTPAKLFAPTDKELNQGIDDLIRQFGKQRVLPLKDKIAGQGVFPGLENYLPYFIPTAGLPDYLDDQSIVVMDMPGLARQKSEGHADHWHALYKEHRKKEPLLPEPESLFLEFDRLSDYLAKHHLVQTGLLKQTVWDGVPVQKEWSAVIKGTTPFRGNLELLIKEARALWEKGNTIHVTAHNEAEQRRLKELLADYAARMDCPDLLSHMVFHVGQLIEGFNYPACQFVLFTDQELFNRRLGRPKPRRQKGTVYPSQPIADILELKTGDLAVHRDHGVARYMGVTKLSIDSPDQEFVLLAYAGDEKLYVPMDQLRLVEKYVGSDHSPRINKLGSTTWEKTKQKVKASVTELARQLLDIYASRQTNQAYTFKSDTTMQRDFEEAFPYEETPDQIRAITEVKQDMMSPKPMDRLICGDVGFGKTEVAMRAAFKAVQDGFQVAVLVPTTILADQHYATFKERMAAYPVKVELLSRFKNPAEQREIVNGLITGEVDIIIGTHKILGKNIKFKKLGLFILDEEQHFGVAQKEKLKKIRSTIDVLTLTATPIPRTLYLSMSGIRDISVIETPPLNRLPIKTQVMEFSETAIKEAIMREMARGGQIFFIHNRVQSIGAMGERIKRLVPEARVAVAHGQMNRDELEPVMERFVAKAEDILVSTTIVESGLDMPNVNTIIINRADALGMAQLYQLRGRVGRADRQAYAYLLYPQGGAVTSDAEKRLNSLQEFTELGSGIKIAMRDMEIRGTGDVLGPDQSGHVTAVGFETYCSLLEEAVKEIKGQKQEELVEVKMNLGVEAYLPKDFIPDTMTRLNLYKRLSSINNIEDIKRLKSEISQRYGSMPVPANVLVEITGLKLMAKKAGLSEVSVKARTVYMQWPRQYQPDHELVDRLLADKNRRIRFIPGEEIGLEMEKPEGNILEGVKNCLSELI